MEEDRLPFPFPHRHRRVGEGRQLARQRRQLVIVRGEKTAASVTVMQMFKRRPGDGQAIIGRGAAPDLV